MKKIITIAFLIGFLLLNLCNTIAQTKNEKLLFGVAYYDEYMPYDRLGQRQYGARQNMDITNKRFLFHAERVIRKIMEHVKNHPAIIGYQVDNETKHYNTSGANVQKAFVQYMKNKFKSLDNVNKSFGLDYWSNRINSWNDFPLMVGSINASLNAEFAKFQRQLVTNYLAWQTKIVKIEISFGGDMARSMNGGKNYFVIETEAQGFPQWVPYPNQLRLQAFSHLASGANMLAYWHWHSIHNSAETYWRGLLSHDFESNPTYNEAKTIGKDFDRLSDKLINLKKNNEVAILFSNEALTAFNAFSFGWGARENYNDILRPYYDALYKMNVGVDFIDPSVKDIIKYKLIIVPALYAASDDLLKKLNQFVYDGGHIVYTFKSGFSDENVKVRITVQPGIINEACGISYSQFTIPQNVSLKNDPFQVGAEQNKVHTWMELITPTTAKVLAYYDHSVWGTYAAITQNQFGKGMAVYIGCMTSAPLTEKILKDALQKSNL